MMMMVMLMMPLMMIISKDNEDNGGKLSCEQFKLTQTFPFPSSFQPCLMQFTKLKHKQQQLQKQKTKLGQN